MKHLLNEMSQRKFGAALDRETNLLFDRFVTEDEDEDEVTVDPRSCDFDCDRCMACINYGD